jgi:hypothetical protein
MTEGKLRVLKDYEKLSDELLEKLKEEYPTGYSNYIIQFPNKEGRLVRAIELETENKIYMIRLPENVSGVNWDDDSDDENVENDTFDDAFDDVDTVVQKDIEEDIVVEEDTEIEDVPEFDDNDDDFEPEDDIEHDIFDFSGDDDDDDDFIDEYPDDDY